MKAIKPNIRLNGNKYHIVVTRNGKTTRKTYDTLQEAEEALRQIDTFAVVKNFEYPDDFIDAIFGDNEKVDINYITEHFEENIKEALQTLTDREQEVMNKRFVEGYTLEATGRQMGITRERVRQIEAKSLRKLKHPARNIILRKGKEAQLLQDDINKLIKELMLKKEELINSINAANFTKEELLETKSIEELDFSVRTFNCLKRSKVNTLNDLIKMSDDDLYKVRNLGRKSLREIKEKLKERGLSLKWIYFILIKTL